MIKLEINGEVLTVKFDEEQMKMLTEVFERVTAKEIRRQIRVVMKEEAEK